MGERRTRWAREKAEFATEQMLTRVAQRVRFSALTAADVRPNANSKLGRSLKRTSVATVAATSVLLYVESNLNPEDTSYSEFMGGWQRYLNLGAALGYNFAFMFCFFGLAVSDLQRTNNTEIKNILAVPGRLEIVALKIAMAGFAAEVYPGIAAGTTWLNNEFWMNVFRFEYGVSALPASNELFNNFATEWASGKFHALMEKTLHINRPIRIERELFVEAKIIRAQILDQIRFERESVLSGKASDSFSKIFNPLTALERLRFVNDRTCLAVLEHFINLDESDDEIQSSNNGRKIAVGFALFVLAEASLIGQICNISGPAGSLGQMVFLMSLIINTGFNLLMATDEGWLNLILHPSHAKKEFFLASQLSPRAGGALAIAGVIGSFFTIVTNMGLNNTCPWPDTAIKFLNILCAAGTMYYNSFSVLPTANAALRKVKSWSKGEVSTRAQADLFLDELSSEIKALSDRDIVALYMRFKSGGDDERREVLDRFDLTFPEPTKKDMMISIFSRAVLLGMQFVLDDYSKAQAGVWGPWISNSPILILGVGAVPVRQVYLRVKNKVKDVAPDLYESLLDDEGDDSPLENDMDDVGSVSSFVTHQEGLLSTRSIFSAVGADVIKVGIAYGVSSLGEMATQAAMNAMDVTGFASSAIPKCMGTMFGTYALSLMEKISPTTKLQAPHLEWKKTA